VNRTEVLCIVSSLIRNNIKWRLFTVISAVTLFRAPVGNDLLLYSLIIQTLNHFQSLGRQASMYPLS